jgi:hypothetical protein
MNNVSSNAIFDAAWYLSGWNEHLKKEIDEAVKDDYVNKLRHAFFLAGVRYSINSYLNAHGIKYRDELTEEIVLEAAAYFKRMGVLEEEFYNALFIDQQAAYSIIKKISLEDMGQMVRDGKLTLEEIANPLIDPTYIDDDML